MRPLQWPGQSWASVPAAEKCLNPKTSRSSWSTGVVIQLQSLLEQLHVPSGGYSSTLVPRAPPRSTLRQARAPAVLPLTCGRSSRSTSQAPRDARAGTGETSVPSRTRPRPTARAAECCDGVERRSLTSCRRRTQWSERRQPLELLSSSHASAIAQRICPRPCSSCPSTIRHSRIVSHR